MVKTVAFIFIALLAADKVFADVMKSERCKSYSDIPFDEAKRTLFEKSQKANFLGVKLAEIKKAGIPDNDPKSVEVARPLGKTLGEMYRVCRCNIKLSETYDCINFVKLMDESIYSKQK